MVSVSLIGCGDDGASPIDATVSTDALACSADAVMRGGTTYKYGGGGNGPFPGVKVCLDGRADACTISDSIASFSICIPRAADYTLRAFYGGYETAVFLYGAADPGPLGTETGDNAVVTQLWADSGATFPPTTSSLLFVAVTTDAGPLPNATVAISPNLGIVSYGDASQAAHRLAGSTSTSGTVYVGDLPAGMYDVTVTATPAVTCVNESLSTLPTPPNPPRGGFGSPTAGAAVRVPTFAGATTNVYLHCTP